MGESASGARAPRSMANRFAWIICWLSAMIASAGIASAASAPPEKAARYHQLLARRPSPGYLFDRFYNAWLDESTVEELEKFLVERAESGESGDGLLLAFFYAKQGDDLRAIEQFRSTLKEDPGNASAWYEKAIIEARTLDFETALADLKQAAAAEPDEKLAIQIAKLRGKLLVRDRKRSEAIDVWKQLLDQHPDDEDLAEDVIELEIEEALLDEAAALSRQLIERTKDPYKRVLRELRLGDILDRSGKRAEAIDIYQATLDRVGAESWLEREILAQIERVFRREDDLGGLQKQYEKLLEQHPRRVGVHRAYARLLSERGDARAAIEKFQEILKLTPGDRANQEAFIELHVKADDIAGAVKHLTALIEQHPEDGELLVQLSQLQAKQDDKKAAAESIDRFLANSDQSEYAYLRAARLLEQLELSEAAKAKYVELTEKFPDSIAAKESLGAFLYKLGEKDEALAVWRSLAESADAQHLVRIARTLASRNEHEVAYEILEKRQAQFENDWLFLGQLVAEAIANKKYAEAIPWALARVERSQTSSELNDAIAQASSVIERAEKVAEMLDTLQQGEHRSLRRACLLAELFELSGDAQQADSVLKPWIAKGESLAVMQQVRLCTRRYDWTGASKAMRALVDLPGERKSENVRRLVELYERDFRLEEALKWVAEWKKLSPGSTMPWSTESRLLMLSGKEGAALETLREAVKEFDGNDELRAQLAQLYAGMGKYADAQRIYWLEYEQSESLSDKLRAVDQLARLAEQQGNVEQLVENFEERRQGNRQSVEPLLALATIHRVANDYERRRQALAAASKLKPDDLALLHEIARIEEQEGDWERARATLEAALALDKTSRTRQRLARLVIRYGDPEEGFAMLYELAGGEKSDPRDIESMADAMIGVGDWQRAKELLTTHVDEHPEDYRLRYLLGIVCEEEGEEAAAIEEFLATVRAEKEIQKLGRPAPGGVIPNNYLAELGELLPKEAIDIVQFQQARHMAYAYRQQHASWSSAVSFPGGTTRIQLPGSLEQARQYALMHLFSIAQLRDEEGQAQIASRVRGAGVANAEVLMAVVPPNVQGSIPGSDVLEKFPDNKAIRAVMLMGLAVDRLSIPEEFYHESYEQFVETRPQLALLAAIQGAAQDPEQHDLLDDVENLLERIEKPNSLLVMQLATSLGRIGGQVPSGELPEGARKAIMQKVVDWYPSVRDKPPYGQYMFMYASRALRTGGDPREFVRLLEDEVARHRSGGAGAVRQQAMYYGGHQQQFLELPTFPPTELADFPASVLQLVSPNSQAQDIFGFRGHHAWDSDKVVPLLPDVKDPILKVLLAVMGGDEATADETLDALLASDSPMLDAYLLGAARAVAKEEYARAIELYEKARYLPMNRAVRRTLDESLLAVALDQTDLLQGDDNLQQAARDAALRLRHGAMQPDQRSRLVTALEELGLGKEAELLEKKASVSASVRPAARYSVQSTTPVDHLRKLIDQGKRDVVARTLANEAIGLMRQGMSNPGNWSYNSYQVRQFREKIAKYRLAEDVAAEVDPGESTSHRKWAECAMVHDALGNSEEALAAYEKALELRPREDAYRTRVVLLSVAKDPAKALAHCDGFGRAGITPVIGSIFGLLRDHETEIAERLELAEFAQVLFRHQAKEDPSELVWAPWVCEAIGSRLHGRNGSIPALYMPASASDIYGRRASDKLLERREKLHDGLCREMLAFPAVAEEAFTLLLASQEARDAIDEEMAETARQVLLRAEKLPTSNPYAQYRVYYSNNELVVPRRTAAEFLIADSFKRGDWSAVDDEVLPHLAKAGRRDLVQEIETFRALYECEPEEFVDTAENYVRHARRSMPQHARYQGREPEQLVCEAWRDRELDVDLEALVLEFAEQSKREQMSTGAPNYLMRYAKDVAERDSERAIGFLERLAEVYLGPKDRREDFIQRNYNQRSISSNSPNATIHAFGKILQTGLQDERLLVPTLALISDGNLAPIVQNFEHHVRNGLKNAVAAMNAREILTYLAELGIVGDVEQFATHALVTTDGQQTLLYFAAMALREADEAKEKEIKQRLEENGNFGSTMLLAEWSGEDKATSGALKQLSAKLDTLQGLGDPAAGRLAKALASAVKLDASKLSDGERQVVEWIVAQNSDRGRSMAEKILKAKRVEDLQMPGYDPAEWFAGMLPDLVRHDMNKAAGAYFKLCELYQDGMQRNAVNYYFSDVTSEMLSRSINRLGDTDVLRTRILLAVLAHEKGDTVAFTSYQFDRMTEPLRRQWRSDLDDVQNAKQPIHEAAKKFHAWLEESIGEPSAPILPMAFYRALGEKQLSDSQMNELDAWLKETAAAHPEDANWQDLLAGSGYFKAIKERNKAKEKDEDAPQPARAEMAGCYEHYLAILDDDEVPASSRLLVAQFLFDREAEKLPTEVSLAILRLGKEAASKKVRLVDDHHQKLARNALQLAEDGRLEEVREFLAAWHARFGRVAASAANSYSRDPDVLNSSSTLVRMLALYLAAGAEEDLNQFVRRYDSSLGQRPETAALLVRADRAEMALRSLRAQVPLVVSNLTPPVVVYDGVLAEKSEPFLASIGDEQLRYCTRVSFALLEDPPSAQEGHKPRDERLVELARQFSDIEWKAKDLEQKALLMLCANEKAMQVVRGDVERVAEAIDLPAIAGSHSTNFEEAVRLVVKRLEIAAWKGNPRPLARFIQQTYQADNTSDWQLRYSFTRHADALAEATIKHLAAYRGKRLEALAEVLRAIATPRDMHINNVQRWNTLCVVAHARSGQADALRKWHEELEESVRPRLKGNAFVPEGWDWLASTFGERTSENLEARVAAVADLLSLSETFEWLQMDGGLRMQIGGREPPKRELPLAKILSDEEIAAQYAQLVERTSAKGAMAVCLATQLGKNGRWEEAADCWRLAGQGIAPEQVKQKTWIQLERARALAEAGDQAAAESLLEEIEVEPMGGPFRKALEAAKKKILPKEKKSEAEEKSPGSAGEEQKAA